MSEKICRTCLDTELNGEFTKIDSDGNEISVKIFSISGIQIIDTTNQDSTAFICPLCLKELFQCLQFQKKCQNADEYFKTKFSKVVDSNDQPSMLEMVPTEHQGKLLKPSNDDSRKIAAPKLKSLQCKFCGIVLSRRNRRIEHERLHGLDKNKDFFECFLCGKRISQKYALVPHFRKCHDLEIGQPERWKCAICINKVLQPGKMALHYEKKHSHIVHVENSEVSGPISSVHDKKNPKAKRPPVCFWPCSICGNSFSNYRRYQTHLWNVHEITENQLISYRTPEDLSALKTTQMTNENSITGKLASERRSKFPCTTCGKIFSSTNTVRAHEKIHLDIEYHCDLCPSSFRVKSYLTAHVQKIHLKLKKFKCSMCNVSFVHRELLNYHLRKHLRIRNYACRWCAKTFVTRNCCTIHERIHQNKRLFSCQFCSRSFIHHSDHRRHELKHAETDFKNSTLPIN